MHNVFSPALESGLSPTLMIWILVAAFLLLILAYNSIAIVGGTQIAILERRWVGAAMPEGRVVAMRNEVGIQARILGPGLHFLIPFLYRVEKSPMMSIGESEVGLVESIDGQPIPAGRIFARVVPRHNLFQDGEAFLTSGG
jgi:uncharacterized membrane protein YqiK